MALRTKIVKFNKEKCDRELTENSLQNKEKDCIQNVELEPTISVQRNPNHNKWKKDKLCYMCLMKAKLTTYIKCPNLSKSRRFWWKSVQEIITNDVPSAMLQKS